MLDSMIQEWIRMNFIGLSQLGLCYYRKSMKYKVKGDENSEMVRALLNVVDIKRGYAQEWKNKEPIVVRDNSKQMCN